MSLKYDTYLTEHIGNVGKGFEWLVENLPEVIETPLPVEYLRQQICRDHDKSKYLPQEYRAYDEHFYGNNHGDPDVNFQYAWLSHIHYNPHHWQYWILHNDDADEGTVILDMPHNYILEMICDWWSFSWKTGDLDEIFKWYDNHKTHMKLSDKTRETVEDILEKMENKLREIKSVEVYRKVSKVM